MRTLTQKPTQSRNQVTSSSARSNTAIPGPNHVDSISTGASLFTHNFSRIPVYPKTTLSPQLKLTVGTPNDSCEKEADAIADQVTRISNPQVSSLRYDSSAPKPLSALSAPVVQTKSQSATAVSNTLSKKISSSRGGGSQMDPDTLDSMQRSFGADFRHVRIHNDSEAAQMSSELGAYAFTVGRDIYFGSGTYSPDTTGGRHLLAHELTHTIQQERSSAIQKQTATRRQSVFGLGIVNEEERPAGGELPEEGADVTDEDEPLESTEPGEEIQMQIQRSTTWAGATVHETRNSAEDALRRGAPVTWQMLNGTMLKTEADADSSVNLPTISTSGSGTNWTAKVDTVPQQEGGDDETVLSPGPWSIVVPKADVGTRFPALAACTGAGDSTFSALGKPSDDAVYKANRRHEDQHVADDKVAFEETIGEWDKKLEDAKSKGTTFKGKDAAKAKAALWKKMGGKPKQVARKYRQLSFTKGDEFHQTPKGGPMSISNKVSNADCSTSSVDVTNPA